MEDQENKGTVWEVKSTGSDGSIHLGPVVTLKDEVEEVLHLIEAVRQAVNTHVNDIKAGALLRVCRDNFKEVVDTVDWEAMQAKLEAKDKIEDED